MANIIWISVMAILMAISFFIEVVVGGKWALIFLGVFISAEISCLSIYVRAYIKTVSDGK